MAYDYENYPYSDDELEVVDSYLFMGSEVPLFNTPISYEENMERTVANRRSRPERWCNGRSANALIA